MRLDLALLADEAIIAERGKFYIFGEFRYIAVGGLPAIHGRFAVVARFVADVVETRDRENTLVVELVDQDGKPTAVPRSKPIPLRFTPIGPANRGKVQAQIVLKIDGMPITQYGDHTFHFIVNGNHCDGVGFHVAQVREQVGGDG